ncbi:probable tRNA (guanine(26)-N(2))-dimethyltransferase 1 [Ananas comosus]|uniref:tRNA (guanine(26)-N(2))-dimethyltransferase n=1 Tax=Ananas comosus TaxID=4615 RepID=A0A6P5GA81_ANACO|nr:probable tRNA (guanine(26)-N(2))-dimethyltransferase 1 [Ananas comosus]
MRTLIRAPIPLRLRRRPSKSNLSFSSSFSTTTTTSSSSTPNTTICNPNSDDGCCAAAGEGTGDYTIVKEGEADILMDSSNSVFYNKAQVNNRDLSIAVLRTFISRRSEEHAAMLSKMVGSGPKDLKAPRVLEALAASGLRALRYAREVDGIGEVVALDNNKVAVDACKKNIEFNGSHVSSKVVVHEADARVYMLTHPKEFDVVDLDPYGSPVAFLDSVVQTLADGGLLMCTATDMAVLSGGNEGVCFSKYGSYPLKGKYNHEMALRILLACLESHANRHKRYIVPILSVQMDFYIRVFVRIFTSASAMKCSTLKLLYVYQCVGCDSFHMQSLGRVVSKNNSVMYAPGFGPIVPQECGDCGKKFSMGGPIWSAPIHDHDWVPSIMSNISAMKDRYPAYERISAVLTSVSEELLDVPLFVNAHSLCSTLKCTSPTMAMFRSALINAGYRVSGSHVDPLALKTDAPMNIIWDIMRCWIKIHPVKAHAASQPGTIILSREPILEANFAQPVDHLSKSRVKKLPRFLPNPERYWGPKSKAGRQVKCNLSPADEDRNRASIETPIS